MNAAPEYGTLMGLLVLLSIVGSIALSVKNAGIETWMLEHGEEPDAPSFDKLTGKAERLEVLERRALYERFGARRIWNEQMRIALLLVAAIATIAWLAADSSILLAALVVPAGIFIWVFSSRAKVFRRIEERRRRRAAQLDVPPSERSTNVASPNE